MDSIMAGPESSGRSGMRPEPSAQDPESWVVGLYIGQIGPWFLSQPHRQGRSHRHKGRLELSNDPQA